MQIAEVAEAGTELVDNAQAGLRAFYLGDCDGAVQFDDLRAGQAGEPAIQRRDKIGRASCRERV